MTFPEGNAPTASDDEKRLLSKICLLLYNGGGGGGTGTVTSVAMTVPSILSVSGSPVTTTGTLAVTLSNQVANTIFAGPSTGADATPTFRAMVAADIPTTLAPQVARLGIGAAADAANLLTIVGGTVTVSAPVLNLSQTWNSAGVTFTVLKLSITSTASAAASLLMDLQVGGGSIFSIDKSGNVSNATANISSGTAVRMDGNGLIILQAAGSLRWSSTSSVNGTADITLFRDAAGILAQRNTTNAQVLRVWNTFTSLTSGEYCAVADWQASANVCAHWTVKGSGGGTARPLVLGADATELMRFDVSSKISFFAATTVVKQTSGANLNNNVTSGGTTDQIDDFAAAVYATDAATIRNDIYQLAKKLKQINDGLRSYGLFT